MYINKISCAKLLKITESTCIYSSSKNCSYRCNFYFSLPGAALWIISLVILKAQTILHQTALSCDFTLEIGQKTTSRTKTCVFQVPETFAWSFFWECHLKERKILNKISARRPFYDQPSKNYRHRKKRKNAVFQRFSVIFRYFSFFPMPVVFRGLVVERSLSTYFVQNFTLFPMAFSKNRSSKGFGYLKNTGFRSVRGFLAYFEGEITWECSSM